MFKRKMLNRILLFSLLIVAFGGVSILMLSGGNLDSLISIFKESHTNEEIRKILASFGWRGYIAISALAALQVVMAFMPAEPVQVLAGLTFGFPIGLACCMAGVVIGNTFIYLLYRIFGDKLRAYFVRNLHFDFDKAARSKRVTLIVFIMYFLPAIPYGMICFFAASIGMKFPRFITVTVLGAIPSVCIGVGLGRIAISASWIVSVAVFAVLIILLLLVMIKRRVIFGKINAYLDKLHAEPRYEPKKYSPIYLPIAYFFSRIIFFLKGVKVSYKKRIKDKLDTPSIVLCNHGSFIDFAYAGSLIKESRPNFIAARLYFYKRIVGGFLNTIGCFPKSMFTADLESAKGCLKVIKRGGVLAMMPEARLSTAGVFEDIQPGTYAFLKKCGVTVYSIKICGDYLAKPKWGGKMRRGSLVEAELDILFTKEEIEKLTEQEIEKRVIERLSYDEMAWLSEHPKVRYKDKNLAKGLENILCRCPECGSASSLRTKGRRLWCEKCTLSTELDDRYAFKDNKPFGNPTEWYLWQYEKIREEIDTAKDYSLSARVKYKLPSENGKTFLRDAGEGECTLNSEGLTYIGTLEGESTSIHFPLKSIYRLLFGAGESFEVYTGRVINLFYPEDGRTAVEWYIASRILYDKNFPCDNQQNN